MKIIGLCVDIIIESFNTYLSASTPQAKLPIKMPVKVEAAMSADCQLLDIHAVWVRI